MYQHTVSFMYLLYGDRGSILLNFLSKEVILLNFLLSCATGTTTCLTTNLKTLEIVPLKTKLGPWLVSFTTRCFTRKCTRARACSHTGLLSHVTPGYDQCSPFEDIKQLSGNKEWRAYVKRMAVSLTSSSSLLMFIFINFIRNLYAVRLKFKLSSFFAVFKTSGSKKNKIES